MTTLAYLMSIVALGLSPEASKLEAAFRGNEMAGLSAAVRELERVHGPEQTAKALAELLRGQPIEIEAAAARTLGRMGDVGRMATADLAEAIRQSDFPRELLDELGAGDIPLWLAETALRPEDPSFLEAGDALSKHFDLKREPRLLPLLTRGLKHRDRLVRYYAARALGEMGETAASTWPLLVDVLKEEPSEEVMEPDTEGTDHTRAPTMQARWRMARESAAVALGQIGAKPKETTALLTDLLNHPHEGIRTSAALGLALLERRRNPKHAAKMLVKLMYSDEMDVQAKAAHELGEMGEEGRVVLPVLMELHESDETYFPFDILGHLGGNDIPLWLTEITLTPHAAKQADAGLMLKYFCLKRERRLLPLLMAGARHPDLEVRNEAVSALGYMKSTASSAWPLLAEIARSQCSADAGHDERILWNDGRGNAALALAATGAHPQQTLQLLTELLEDVDAEVRWGACMGLGYMGPRAAPAVPALIEALATGYDGTFASMITPDHPAAAALVRIGEPTVAALVAVAKDREQAIVRRHAFDAFQRMSEHQAIRQVLIAAATDVGENAEIRVLATKGLTAAAGEYGQSILPTLTELLEDPSSKLREIAAYGMARRWNVPVPTPPLIRLLEDPNPRVRRAAIYAITFQLPYMETVPDMEPLLKDPDVSVRMAAQRLLDAVQSKNSNEREAP